VWVLKDPLSPVLHFFEEFEFGILRSLAKVESLSRLAERYRARIEPDVLTRFLRSAWRAGLLASDSGVFPNEASTEISTTPANTAWWKQPLAIRLPGINPDRLLGHHRLAHPSKLTAIAPTSFGSENRATRSTRAILIGVAIFMCSALTLVLINRAEFVERVTRAGAGLFSGGASYLFCLFALSVLITKVVHEIAHALVFTALGGRCRKMGVMLLMGIPCLYCDVSETWLMPRRWHRMLVSAAGMIAEYVIASIAVCVWAFTDVGTILINANPLLRYDGY